jgi:hypothetical protein
MVPRRRPRRAGTSIVAGARVPAPSRAVCHRLVGGAGAALCGVSRRRRHSPPNSLPAERGRHPMPCSRSDASACLATELCRECSGVVAKPAKRETERSGRAGSGRRVRPTPRQSVPRWCAQRTLAGLIWRSNTLCRLRRLAGLTALRKTVPAGGEALKAGGRLDVISEREARVVQASCEAASFPYADSAHENVRA